MKKYVVDKIMNLIKNNNSYSEVQLEEIRYGIVSIYLLVTKLFIISILTIFLGLFKEFIIFALLYNLVRMPSFGLHATKSWICLLFSTVLLIGLPYLCMTTYINNNIKIILGIIGIIMMFKNSPADTHKKPIINKKRREIYKFISVIIAIVYTVLSLVINNQFISNSFIITLILQCIIISPFSYKIFNLPYNNYKKYLLDHPEMAN